MAFPQIVNTSESPLAYSASTTRTLNTHATITEGNLLLMFLMLGNDRTHSISGWTQLYNRLGASSNYLAVCYYKVAGASEPSTVDIVLNSGTQITGAFLQVSGFSGTPAYLDNTISAGTQYNSPSVTPSWGAADTLWFSIYSARDASSPYTVTAYPTNYTEAEYVYSAGVAGPLAVGKRELNASSEDPGAWTAASAGGGAGATVAIQPIGGGPTPVKGLQFTIRDESGAAYVSETGITALVFDQAMGATTAAPILKVTDAETDVNGLCELDIDTETAQSIGGSCTVWLKMTDGYGTRETVSIVDIA